jgi:hypothetical protein
VSLPIGLTDLLPDGFCLLQDTIKSGQPRITRKVSHGGAREAWKRVCIGLPGIYTGAPCDRS